MRKRIIGRKFARKRGARKALLNALARGLVEHDRVQTTEAKAKETRRLVERLVTRAKKGDLASRRYILEYADASITRKLLEDIAPRYKERPGGYTRVVKLGPRKSDGAQMVILEFVK